MPLAALAINAVVSVTRNWAKDAQGGRVPSDNTTTNYNASVQPRSGTRVGDHQIADMSITHRVYFGSDPLLSVDDKITWGTKVLLVRGILDQAGRGRVFAYDCEERRP